MFARNANGTLAHLAFGFANGTGWHLENLGGAISGSPSAANSSDGNLQVFARGTDGTLRHSWFARSSGWHHESLGGAIA